jgi:DNA-binding MltR family transcriptional regulator
MPKLDKPFRVEVDVSDYAVGAILSQEHKDKWHLMSYLSKLMNEHKRNYEIYDKELLTIITALDE